VLGLAAFIFALVNLVDVHGDKQKRPKPTHHFMPYVFEQELQVMILVTRRLLDPRGNNGVTFQVRRASKLAAILWA
jgi:hypothetical protein